MSQGLHVADLIHIGEGGYLGLPVEILRLEVLEGIQIFKNEYHSGTFTLRPQKWHTGNPQKCREIQVRSSVQFGISRLHVSDASIWMM